MPTRTIAYLRVSTDKQADRGVSLDAQRVKLKAYAELYELDLVEVIVDAGPCAAGGQHRRALFCWLTERGGVDGTDPIGRRSAA